MTEEYNQPLLIRPNAIDFGPQELGQKRTFKQKQIKQNVMVANKMIMKCVCSPSSGFLLSTISSEFVWTFDSVFSSSLMSVTMTYQSKNGTKSILHLIYTFKRKLTSFVVSTKISRLGEASDRFPKRSIIQQKYKKRRKYFITLEFFYPFF